MLAQARSGRVKALAISRATRLPAYPEVPTFEEAGLPDYFANAWFGIHAPAKTPGTITALWNKEVVKIINMPESHDAFQQADLERIGSTAEEFDRFVRKELAKYARVVKDTGMEAQ